MTERYDVRYSQEAIQDIKNIYLYLADELCVLKTAAAQIGRIMKAVRSLEEMPERHVLVSWEPWHSMGMRQMRVDHFVVYYLAHGDGKTVTIVRAFYGGRNISRMIQTEK